MCASMYPLLLFTAILDDKPLRLALNLLAFLLGADRWVPAGPPDAILSTNNCVKLIHKSVGEN